MPLAPIGGDNRTGAGTATAPRWVTYGIAGYTKDDLKRIQDKLNTRPRPTLDLDTPAQRLAALVSQAA